MGDQKNSNGGPRPKAVGTRVRRETEEKVWFVLQKGPWTGRKEGGWGASASQEKGAQQRREDLETAGAPRQGKEAGITDIARAKRKKKPKEFDRERGRPK